MEKKEISPTNVHPIGVFSHRQKYFSLSEQLERGVGGTEFMTYQSFPAKPPSWEVSMAYNRNTEKVKMYFCVTTPFSRDWKGNQLTSSKLHFKHQGIYFKSKQWFSLLTTIMMALKNLLELIPFSLVYIRPALGPTPEDLFCFRAV